MPYPRRRKPGDGPSRRERRDAMLAPGAIIAAVTPDARDPSCVHVRIGRRSAAKIPAEGDLGPAALGLAAGVVLTEPLIALVRRAQAQTLARYWALRLLSRAAQSRAGLILKLQRKGIEAPVARDIALQLEARSLLDDRRYAESIVAAELRRKPAGERLLETKLRVKGIESRLAREVVAAALADQRERLIERAALSAAPTRRRAAKSSSRDHPDDAAVLEPVVRMAQRKFRAIQGRVDDRTAQRRIYGLLARRGFDADTCARVTRQVCTPSDA